MDLLIDVLMDAGLDCLKMLPFLFLAFLLIEALEHHSTALTQKVLIKVGKAGPIVGAIAGCVPQCGFSVMASNLYSGGIISVGTMLAVFTATSDEAILIMLGDPSSAKEVLKLLIVKVIIAIIAGYIIDIFLAKYVSTPKKSGELCDHCGCHDEHEGHGGILMPTLRHTVEVFVYLFIFTLILNLAIEILGIERISVMLLGDTFFQPIIAAVIGLIPNCAASVILTQLYLTGAISFSSVVAGLCASAGIGLVVLFRVNRNRKENLKILATLYGTAVAAGIILQIIGL